MSYHQFNTWNHLSHLISQCNQCLSFFISRALLLSSYESSSIFAYWSSIIFLSPALPPPEPDACDDAYWSLFFNCSFSALSAYNYLELPPASYSPFFAFSFFWVNFRIWLLQISKSFLPLASSVMVSIHLIIFLWVSSSFLMASIFSNFFLSKNLSSCLK